MKVKESEGSRITPKFQNYPFWVDEGVGIGNPRKTTRFGGEIMSWASDVSNFRCL